MKKRIYFVTAILATVAALNLSSCLKDDSRFIDFASSGTTVNFPLGGLSHFGADAVTDAGDTIVKQFAIDVASPKVPTSATDVTIAVDNTIIDAYNPGSAVQYDPMPDGSFVLSATKVTIPAGQRVGVVTVTFYKGLLDPSKSYMLPIKIVSGTGATVSGNYGIHYYHFIGNDFAGLYTWTYTRWQNGTGTGTPLIDHAVTPNTPVNPITPSIFEMETGYNSNHVDYEVTFTKTGPGTYTNWAVTFDPATVSAGWVPVGISVVQPPVFLVLDPANFHFQLQYVAFNGTADRYLIDDFKKP